MRDVSDILFDELENLQKGEVSLDHANSMCELAEAHIKAQETLLSFIVKEVRRHG